jgi:hypothetical protein
MAKAIRMETLAQARAGISEGAGKDKAAQRKQPRNANQVSPSVLIHHWYNRTTFRTSRTLGSPSRLRRDVSSAPHPDRNFALDATVLSSARHVVSHKVNGAIGTGHQFGRWDRHVKPHERAFSLKTASDCIIYGGERMIGFLDPYGRVHESESS